MFKKLNSKKPACFLKSFFFLLVIFPLAGHNHAQAQGKTLTQSVAQNAPADVLVQKYARLLQVSEAEILRFRSLYAFIDTWLGTPYLWGGCSKKGIDCSCFVMTLFDNVYNINVQRTSFTQFYDKDVSLFKNRKKYSTGDLIFFKTNINRETRNNRVTHVGFYLTNGYFVQSSSKGVNIANLNYGFWNKSIVAAGRLKESFYKEAGLLVPAGEVQTDNAQFKAEEDSYFDPPLMNERYDALIKKYSRLLAVAEEELQIPEVLEYIEQNNKQEFNLTNCAKGSNPSTCMVGDLYKKVFGVDVETNQFALQNASAVFSLRKGVDSLAIGDIVFLKTSSRLNYYNKTGVYLHNNYFVHLENGWMIISNLNDPEIKLMRKFFGRLKNEVYDAAGKNLMERRQLEDSLSKAQFQPVDKKPATDTVQQQSTEPLNNNAVTETKPVITLPPPSPLQKSEKSLPDFVPFLIIPFDSNNVARYPQFVNSNAKMLNVHQGFIKDSLVYAFAEKWNRAPYRKRGCAVTGVNEKCFLEKYYSEVLKREISFKVFEEVYQYHALPLKKDDLFTEGDLLFFGEPDETGVLLVKTTGIYLNGKYFIALSPVSKMVEIFSLEDAYFREKFINAARPALK